MRKIGAVILAAGASLRLGRPKQLIEFKGTTLLRIAVEAALGAGCQPALVVLGSDRSMHDAARRILAGTKADILPNEHWPRGLGTSLRAGLEKIASLPHVEGTLVLVCDQPFVSAEIIAALISLQETTHKPIVASSYGGTIGVPALFDRTCFHELLALPDDQGAKPVIQRDPGRVATLPFPAGAIDIDTSADYDALGRDD